MRYLALGATVVLCIALLVPGTGRAAARQDFLAAERALAGGDFERAAELMHALDGYPLLPYLELERAQLRLDTLPHEELRTIYQRHAGLPTAYRLQRAWVERLTREKNWGLIAENGNPASSDAGTGCRSAEALWHHGRGEQAWAALDRIWQTGASLPDECDPVLSAWRAAGRLGPELAWARVRLAVDAGNLRLARYLRRYLAPSAATLLDQWLGMRADAGAIGAFIAAGGLDIPERRHAVHTSFARHARRTPDVAADLLRRIPPRALDSALAGTLRGEVGWGLARQDKVSALDWLDATHDPGALTAGAVVAMVHGRWQTLVSLIDAMPADESMRERWRYWRARALQLSGDASGNAALAALAGERSYYGFLAAHRSGRPYRLGHKTLEASAAAHAAVITHPAFVRAREWRALDRPEEARRDWLHLLAALTPDAVTAAARAAHGMGWHEAAIRAAAWANAWDDLELRFPLAHAGAVAAAAVNSGLRRSRIYAIVRQESAFMDDVRSSAGALGLMQLMPATARQVASRAGEARPATRDLLRPERNLRLGSLYLSGLEHRYAGHSVLASAAYNAGPGRVRKWRPERGEMSSEVWIETLPFTETRRYVRQVLAYQVIYAQRLGESPPDLDAMMPRVLARRG